MGRPIRWVAYFFENGGIAQYSSDSDGEWGLLPLDGFVGMRVWEDDGKSVILKGHDYTIKVGKWRWENRDEEPDAPQILWRAGTLLPDDEWEAFRQEHLT